MHMYVRMHIGNVKLNCIQARTAVDKFEVFLQLHQVNPALCEGC